ncbi:MAG: S49 family peptidase [Gammaproteobacteria bacterium]|nr:S49 family peptidase [Gammaproteobacteria bacterium]
MSQEQDSQILAELVKNYMAGEGKRRKWDLAFRLLKYVVVISVLFVVFSSGDTQHSMDIPRSAHVALVDIEGPIASNENASADNIIGALRTAMEAKHSLAVIMRINSPGGSPVQAGYVYDEIKRLRGLYPEKKIYAVITDMGASAAYYIAAAADEIYADQASIVGSIGVTMGSFSPASFGFTEAMEKMGIERRLITSGESKALLDPFSPLKEADAKHYKQLMSDVHQQFITRVMEGRGKRLKLNKQLFSGLFWTGERSIEFGLIDGLGSSAYVARELIGNDKLFDYTQRPGVFEKFSEQFGSGVAQALMRASTDGSLTLR